MSEEKEPYDLKILSAMASSNAFPGSSIEELICLITIAKEIHDEHDRKRNEFSRNHSHYHLPVNHELAMKVWKVYTTQKETKVGNDPPNPN